MGTTWAGNTSSTGRVVSDSSVVDFTRRRVAGLSIAVQVPALIDHRYHKHMLIGVKVVGMRIFSGRGVRPPARPAKPAPAPGGTGRRVVV